jgi:hypothetical protein
MSLRKNTITQYGLFIKVYVIVANKGYIPCWEGKKQDAGNSVSEENSLRH